MLQAIVRNKARKFLLGGDQRRPVEDVMTDCVFGGLRYLAPKVSGAALTWLLGDLVPTDADVTDIRLWPRRDGVEPDAVIVGHLADGKPFQLIVECKWGENVLTVEQIDRQHAAFVDGRGGGVLTLRAYVVQDRSRVEEALLRRLSASPADHRLLTWRDLAATLARTRTQHAPPEAQRWAEDVGAVLGDMGERPFSGDWPRRDVPEAGPNALFYRDADRHFLWPSISIPPAPASLYYAGPTEVAQGKHR